MVFMVFSCAPATTAEGMPTQMTTELMIGNIVRIAILLH
jgi:hypothetical protein